MNVLVLGGDGFCGWPTALRLKAAGHNVHIVDNGSRRNIDRDLGTNSLTDISDFDLRCKTAEISFEDYNLHYEYDLLVSTLRSFKPDAIVHFAEQRAAPYSMISAEERRYTVDNNINATHNVLSAIVDVNPDIHLVHLGTMGVYGYNDVFGDIPEGYLDITVKETQRDASILYPTAPGSVYHMTKSLDQIMFQFYNKNWGLKITDLHQGIVWGTQTKETQEDPLFVNRFDYDGIYGTVLNRFLVQAAIGEPLSVYGTGGQTRAFIHINDTAECIKLAVENPPARRSTVAEQVRIYNQVAETHTLIDLARMIAKNYNAEIAFLDNPRKELAENKLTVHNEGLQSLGFDPIKLNKELVNDIEFLAGQLQHNANRDVLLNSPRW